MWIYIPVEEALRDSTYTIRMTENENGLPTYYKPLKGHGPKIPEGAEIVYKGEHKSGVWWLVEYKDELLYADLRSHLFVWMGEENKGCWEIIKEWIGL